MKVLSFVLNGVSILKVMSDIRGEFGDKSAPSKPHVTIRGPFKDISKNIVKKASDIALRPDFKILLSGTGCFQVGEQIYVYIAVKSDLIRSVWRKPDYPIKKGFYNPHVTIYRGMDFDIANNIAKKYAKFSEVILSDSAIVSLDSIGQSEFEF